MTGERREGGTAGSDGTTAVVLLTADGGTSGSALADEVRDALRTTDAVLAREDDGVISVLLRGLRDGDADVALVTERLAARCGGTDRPLRIGTAVAEGDEPLDLLVARAREALAGHDPG